MKKYELTDEKITVDDHTLYRIRACENFFINNSRSSMPVRKGSIGGFVENESNLSHDDTCWVFDNAKIYGRAKVYGHAVVKNQAIIKDNARVFGVSLVKDDTLIEGNAVVCDGVIMNNAIVKDNAFIFCAGVNDNVKVKDFAHVEDGSVLFGNTIVMNNACVSDHSHVINASVSENAIVIGHSYISDFAKIKGNAYISGGSRILGHVEIGDNVKFEERVCIKGDADLQIGSITIDIPLIITAYAPGKIDVQIPEDLITDNIDLEHVKRIEDILKHNAFAYNQAFVDSIRMYTNGIDHDDIEVEER